jgi:WD domain, G-beta repeat
VLVFDQFEELFTLGASDNLARKRTEYFLQEFAALAEGVHTAPVRRRFEENPGAKAACDFDKRSFKIVLCIREDFLPHLADREELFPSVLRQSMRLEELSRDQALKVVEKPGGHLVAPGVAEQIVDFVSGSWSSDTSNGNHTYRPAKRGVDPSILSLVCQQLNDQRKARQRQSGIPELIEAAQLAGGGAERIIEQYYRESVADLPALRAFIEQGLVTREGQVLAILGLVFAVFYAFRSALNKRLAEEQSAVALQQKTRADYAARDATIAAKQAEEMSKEALKDKKFADEATKAAEESASRVQEQLARAQMEEGRAWIERAKVNYARGDHFAAALMAARALGFVGFGRETIVDTKFNEEYPVLLSTANDPIDEQEARREINEAVLTGYFGWPLWQTPVYRQHEGPVNSVAWSPDGKTLVSSSDDKTVKLWEAATGKLLSTLQGHSGQVNRA